MTQMMIRDPAPKHSRMAADKTITLAVNNMDCAACPSIVKGSLEAVPGVAKVAVSFKDKTATVIYDDAKANVNQLTSAMPNGARSSCNSVCIRRYRSLFPLNSSAPRNSTSSPGSTSI
ncbi:MAG: cation transporter [Bradyrhizobium sp.]|nr:cation transporter [Bradyrhizobium sp.]